jgi:hypothetical protein
MGSRSNVLLVGNGPNRVASNPSWAALLNDVSVAVHGTPVKDEDYKTKPFPILYERLLLEARRNLRWTETRLKSKLAEKTGAIVSGEIHQQLMALPFDEVLTTNYDQALEREARVTSHGKKSLPFVRETRYSLFRHVLTDDGRRLWYIHGDCRNPTSILLGYDQYAGFLQQIRLYVTAKVQYEKGAAGPVFKRFARTSENRSWVTRFFDADVWIVGLGLDFVEIHLWWLLTYRARLRSQMTSANNGNVVRYICRGDIAEDDAKLSLMRTLDVEPLLLGNAETEWNEFYAQAVEKIRSTLPNKALQPTSRARKNAQSKPRPGAARG